MGLIVGERKMHQQGSLNGRRYPFQGGGESLVSDHSPKKDRIGE